MSMAVPAENSANTHDAAQPYALPQITIWKNKPFLILLFTSFLLTIGNKIYELVLPLIMYEITHSSVSMASMRTAELLPNLLFAVFIGVIVDRVNKKRWVQSMIAAQIILLVALVLLVKTGTQMLFLYYAIGFLLMTFNYGYFNAQVSLTKLSVPTPLLTSANAKFSFVETFVGIMGPAVSGLILLLAHLYDGLILTVAAYMICFALLAKLPVQKQHAVSPNVSLWRDLLEGWAAFRSNRALWMMTIFVLLLNSTSTVAATTVIFFAKDDLQLSSSLLAIVLATAGIGGLAASMVMSRLRGKFGLGTLFGFTAIVHAVSFFLTYCADGIALLIIALLLSGFAGSVYSISIYTFRHEQTPPHLIGRISGITGTLFRLGMPVTMYLSGWMTVWWGASSVFLCTAILNVLIFAVYFRTSLWKIQ